MRTITFRRLAPISPSSSWVSDTLGAFLLEVPGLVYFGYVPSREVINAFLAEGRADAGMSGGCEWRPFSITAEEYSEVLSYVRSESPLVGGHPLRFADVPPTVRRRTEWHAWVMQTEMSIPYDEHLRLMDREAELKRRSGGAEPGSRHAMELHLEWIAAATELQKLSDPYIERYREKRNA